MASIMTYNPATNKWEVQHSSLASEIAVADIDANYTKPEGAPILTAEHCFKEVKDELKEMKKTVDYIYQNGTIGGGGGGGGSSSLPTIKLESEPSIIARTDEIVKIYSVCSSPTGGLLKLDYSLFDTAKNTVVDSGSKQIKMGKTVLQFGPLEKGIYKASFIIEDSAGFVSNSVEVEITVGALELNTQYPSSSDITLADTIVIPYNVVSAFTDAVTATYTIDGIERTEAVSIGANRFNVGKFDSYGVHSAKIVTTNGKVTSNELFFNFVVTDTENLFISTEFTDNKIFEVGRTISVDYRLSMFGESKFKVYKSINDVPQPVEVKDKTTHYWNIDGLEPGDYKLKIHATTMDGAITSNEIILNVSVVVNDFIPMKHVTRNMTLELDATNKSQSAADRDVWKNFDDSPICKLHNFNYKTNGWMDNSLVFNGKTYAMVDYQPFLTNAVSGLTIDILCKIENVGDIGAYVFFCKNLMTPYQGAYIDAELASLSSWDAKEVDTNFQDNKFTQFTFVIDRDKQLLLLYVNGVMSKAVSIPSSDRYEFPGKICLGGGYDIEGNIVHTSASAIKSLRIYNTALTKEEVLQNYVAGIKDIDEQKALRTLNGMKIDKDTGAVIFEPISMPTLRISGNTSAMSDVNEVPLRIVFTDTYNQNNNFALDQCMVMWQGTSSRAYPIKNYTMKLRKGGDDFMFAPRPGWKPEYRFTLKADFMESSHSNNTGIARYVTDMLKYNPNPAQQKDPEYKIAVDGFPIQLYINDEYLGIYNFNLDRYSHNNYGLKGEQRALQYEVSTNSADGAGAFMTDDWEKMRIEFKYRYHYAGGEEIVCEKLPTEEIVLRDMGGYHDELKRLVRWVMNAVDGEFEAELHEHFDINSLIDYYLIVYVLGLVDSYGKNMVLSTWGRNAEGHTIWWMSYYDLDSAIGLTNDGKFIIKPDADVGGRWVGDNGDYNTSNSLLWKKLRDNKVFANRIATRYRQLRDEGWFTAEKFLDYYENQTINHLGQRYFNDDAIVKYVDTSERKWIHLALGTRLEPTRRWLRERFIYLDSVYEYGEYLKFGIMRSNVYGKVILGIKTYSPMMLKVKMTSAAIMKQYVNRNNSATRDGFYEFEYTFTNDHDNEITIYGAPNLMSFRTLEDLYLSSFEMGEASRLTEVVCRNSSYLVRMELSNNIMLQKLDVSNCRKLGTVSQYTTLNLEKCKYLRHVNASGTKIGSVILNQVGGVLDYLNLNGTDIRDFSLVGQEYLSQMDIKDCRELSTVNITACNALTAIEVPNSKVSEFRVVDCNKITKIDVSRTGYLRILDLSGCPELLDLNMSSTSNPAIKEIDLRVSEKLQTLDISDCTALNSVWLSDKATGITNLKCAGSAIKYFRFGREPINNYLDLGRFNIENISFTNCTALEEIRNANIGRTHPVSGALFRGCTNLKSISGYLRMSGSISQAFYGCSKITKFGDTFDLTDVTSCTEAFTGCRAITMSTARSIMHKMVNLSGSTWRMFNNCPGIVSDDANPFPVDFYSKCTKLTIIDRIFSGENNIRGPFPYGIYDKNLELQRLTVPWESCVFSSPDKVAMDNIFKFNTKLIALENPFYGVKLDDAPTKLLLAGKTALNNVTSLLSGQTSMYSSHRDFFIDPEFFKDNVNLVRVDGCFYNCNKLDQGIPPDLLRNCTKIENMSQFMDGCSKVTGSIPANFIPYALNSSGQPESRLKNINYLFRNCSSLTGAIPESLLLNHDNIIYANYVFNNCTSLAREIGQVPPNIFSKKYLLQSIEGFFMGCTDMIFDLPEGLFHDCTALNNISYFLSDCKRVSGTLPENWFACFNKEGIEVNNKIMSAIAVFRNCNELGGRVPETLFDKFREVTNLSEFMLNCWNIRGGIPKRLFYNTRNLTTVRSFFQMPWDGQYPNRLGSEKLPTEDDAEFGEFIFHPSLFSRCSMLKDTSYFVHACFKLTGKLHEDTFKGLEWLENTRYMFAATPVSGTISRATFATNRNLTDMVGMFWSSSLSMIEPDCIRAEVHTKLNNLERTFSSNGNMLGEAPKLWITHPGATKQYCFAGCSKLTNWNEIPPAWGGPEPTPTP